jgi:non-ribosomal peptide synthetase component F
LEFKRAATRNKNLRFLTSREDIELDECLFHQVRDFARNQNSTPYIVVLAALNVLLYRLTGQRDIRIGTMMANRPRRESEDTIGHFVNTVVLRTRINPNLGFGELLNTVRNVFFATYAHQELPFEVLARVLENERSLHRESLFQVLLSYRTSVFQPNESFGVQFASWNLSNRNIGVELTATTFDLTFTLTETTTKLTGTVNYNVDAFDQKAITLMIKHFNTVVENSLKQPGEPIKYFCRDTI